jgi:LmbE family N-acetylglucosaminyl deacetylase
MLRMTFGQKQDSFHRVLCLGAHCDDIEIGCGGAVLRLIDTYPDLSFTWIVFSSTPSRAKEAVDSANLFLCQAKEREVIVKEFRDGYFPYIGAQIKDYFEQIKQEIQPDLIFTHYRQDLHQDHRLISELTWNTFRNHQILEYEIPKYDGDLGTPNFFIHLDADTCQNKIQYILSSFQTQQNNHWFTEDAFRSILRLRGLESVSPSNYAEGFFSRKAVF